MILSKVWHAIKSNGRKAEPFKRNQTPDFYPPIHKQVHAIVLSYVEQHQPFHFMQIGSNNGSLNDPMYPFFSAYPCNGILIEPVPYIFDELKKTYAHLPHLHLENCAVSNLDGEMDFYMVQKSEDPSLASWYNQISSFDKKYILKHKKHFPNIESLIVEQKVPCHTISTLLERYGFKDLDILHIDTEGYDYEIIKTINFKQTHPAILWFEHQHLSTNHYRECLHLLSQHYKTIYRNETWDTICFDPFR